MSEKEKIKEIALKHNISLIYLFGSKATGNDSKLSDIDIAVLLDKYDQEKIKDLMLDLIFEFSQIFKNDKIDLVILNKAPLALQYNVVAHGKVLYERDIGVRMVYENKAIKLYLDFKIYEDEYYKAMHERILNGK
ncbi:MAG: type VII toxin-antitoxin system MntA family adenylyltransferase antitoxin [Promethearchaeota archaeon]